MINYLESFKILKLIKNKIFPFYKEKATNDLMKKFKKFKSSENENAMFVGGCVRKFLKNEVVDDIDIATIFSPQEIKKIFLNSEYKLVETGLKHGSVTLIKDKKKFEITVLRKDVKTDGRHADIERIEDWNEDSNRRDFTINSIYMNHKGKLFDPQNGIQDLKNNVVKFIGDPSKRIEEDFLRIIRYLRFSLQYNSNPDNQTLKIIKLNINKIGEVSKERLLSELRKILKLENFLKIDENNDFKEIFILIFPEFRNLNKLKRLKKIQKIYQFSEILLLASMLIDGKDNHEYFCHKYKTSNLIKEDLKSLANGFFLSQKDKNFFKSNFTKNLYRFKKEKFIQILILNFLDRKENDLKKLFQLIQFIKKTKIPKFIYDGSFLKNRGLKEGKKLGNILKEIENLWVSNNFKISDKEINELVEKSN